MSCYKYIHLLTNFLSNYKVPTSIAFQIDVVIKEISSFKHKLTH